MSKLDRMNLMGIRSFGPEDADVQKIKFESPLTLIQGQNGCGKTTIIEAIKFAITGELPGGTARGQGFVYDPKLAKAFESVGKVKLRVINGRGELVTVMKIVRVLQKVLFFYNNIIIVCILMKFIYNRAPINWNSNEWIQQYREGMYQIQCMQVIVARMLTKKCV